MGVPSSECELVANLVAIKTTVNEFAAYGKLSEYIAQGIIRYKVPLFQPSQKYRLPVNHQRPVSCQT
jgi:hypothetical protein